MDKSELDWLGMNPQFYRKSDGSNVSKLRSQDQWSPSPVGVELFLEYGYAVFGHTPLEDIAFALPGSEYWNSKTMALEEFEDPAMASLDLLSEENIPWAIREKLNQELRDSDELIILPLSGGYDSRLLLWCLRDLPRERIRTFSYGTSSPQSMSREVRIAAEIARLEGVQWNAVELGHFNKDWEAWDQIMGPSVHAHGMYHVEFYREIARITNSQKAVLISGLLGDAFAGGVEVRRIMDHNDLGALGMTHGLSLGKYQKSQSLSLEVKREYIRRKSAQLDDPRLRIVELARTKMMLLRYLLEVPRNFEFRPIAPLTDINVAMSMLNLPPQRRLKRIWQAEFFSQHGLGLTARERRTGTTNNSLDFQSIKKSGESLPRIFGLEGVVEKKILRKARKPLSISLAEDLFVSGNIGGAKKSALTNLFDFFSPSLSKYRAIQILFPLAKAFKNSEGTAKPGS